jgi:hypothetical protein
MKEMDLAGLRQKWEELKRKLADQFDEEPDLQSILFLIGVQELGAGYRKFTKDQKMDLMHIAVCKLLSYYGYYELVGLDSEGWPHWKNREKIPPLTLQQQDRLLKQAAIEYFTEIGML